MLYVHDLCFWDEKCLHAPKTKGWKPEIFSFSFHVCSFPRRGTAMRSPIRGKKEFMNSVARWECHLFVESKMVVGPPHRYLGRISSRPNRWVVSPPKLVVLDGFRKGIPLKCPKNSGLGMIVISFATRDIKWDSVTGVVGQIIPLVRGRIATKVASNMVTIWLWTNPQGVVRLASKPACVLLEVMPP